jgi:LEA14-like dessication related protein
MKKRPPFSLLFFIPICFFACTSPPSPGEMPPSRLEFDRIEAESIDRVVLHYRFRVENPRPLPLEVKVRDWTVRVDGRDHDRNAAALIVDGRAPAEALVEVPAGGFVEKDLSLELDLEACGDDTPAAGDPENYRAELLLNLACHYGKARPLAGEAAVLTSFPRIREPEFTITAIAIMQAELINTRFRVNLRIDNPNVFPVDLSSFGYELYGAGRFWAGGREDDVLHIPAQGSAETRLFLMMNFINMKRSLLDEVIALRQVRYRFTGEAEVGTGVSWLPRFRMGFDRSGDSAVYK